MAGTEQNGNGEAEGDGEAADKASQKHPFPTMTMPSPVNAGPKALFPELYFSLFADQDIEVCFSRRCQLHFQTNECHSPSRPLPM